jgi:hypothetical protein
VKVRYYLIIVFVLFFFLFVIGCQSYEQSETTVIVSEGFYGARIKYIGRRPYHPSHCYVYNCHHCKMRFKVIKHICYTSKYGEVYTRIIEGERRERKRNYRKNHKRY